MNHDLYLALASDQHTVFNQLEPARGRVFIQDSRDTSENAKLYPLATNKEFALVYAKPKDVVRPDDVALKLYELFDQEGIQEEVEEMLEEDEYFKEENFPAEGAEEREGFKKVKRELEIKLRQEAIVEEYLTKLTKRNDPYEPIR
ncbi:unnamed protein product, partial [marine sediment metagenome]